MGEVEQLKEAIELIDKGEFDSNNPHIIKMNETLKFIEKQKKVAKMNGSKEFINYYRECLKARLEILVKEG